MKRYGKVGGGDGIGRDSTTVPFCTEVQKEISIF